MNKTHTSKFYGYGEIIQRTKNDERDDACCQFSSLARSQNRRLGLFEYPETSHGAHAEGSHRQITAIYSVAARVRKQGAIGLFDCECRYSKTQRQLLQARASFLRLSLVALDIGYVTAFQGGPNDATR